MRTIILTHNKIALIDDEDFIRVNQLKWQAITSSRTTKWYAASGIDRILLHRFVLNLSPNDLEVDHKDGDGLNCQKHNLRVATRSQNKMHTAVAYDEAALVHYKEFALLNFENRSPIFWDEIL